MQRAKNFYGMVSWFYPTLHVLSIPLKRFVMSSARQQINIHTAAVYAVEFCVDYQLTHKRAPPGRCPTLQSTITRLSTKIETLHSKMGDIHGRLGKVEAQPQGGGMFDGMGGGAGGGGDKSNIFDMDFN